jgi:Rrf2 family protein
MNITRATEYSIRALLHLAERYPDPVVPKEEICGAEGITAPFLTKILQPLVRSGMVRSKRGVAGGFGLIADPEKITLFDVMEAAKEPLALNACVLEEERCGRVSTCPVHDLWVEARGRIEEVFSRRSVADLARERARREGRAG